MLKKLYCLTILLALSITQCLAHPITAECSGHAKSRIKIFSRCKYKNNDILISVKCVIKNSKDSTSVAIYHSLNTTEVNSHLSLTFAKKNPADSITGTCNFPATATYTVHRTRNAKAIPVFHATSNQHGITKVVITNFYY